MKGRVPGTNIIRRIMSWLSGGGRPASLDAPAAAVSPISPAFIPDGGTATDALERYRALVDISHDAVLVTDLAGRILLINQEAATQQRVPDPASFVGRDMLSFIAPEERDTARRNIEVTLREGSVRRLEYTLMRDDGTTFPAEISASVIRGPDGRPSAFLGIVRDLTERKQADEQLKHYALHDSLTTLPNTELFREHVARSVERAMRQDGWKYAVLLLDLDRFKNANESLGHHAGDQLLMGVSARLKECLRPGDILARYGGDEFALLLNALAEPAEAVRIADQVQRVLKAPFRIQGTEVFISASAGIAHGLPTHAKAEDVMRDAAAALARAKGMGKARSVVYADGMQFPAVKLVQLENDLRHAVDRLEFEVYYQPLVSLRDGSIVAMEALVRWRHPTRNLVLPAEFIPMAEDTGLIEPIGEWVLRTAAAHRRGWRPAVARPLRVSVNVSARQFQRTDLPALVRSVLEDTGLAAGSVTLEITESVAMENLAHSAAVLGELERMGVEVSIDDFGIGYSSLNYLRKLPIRTVKVDQSFVHDLATSSDDAAITQAIVAMAHSLGLLVVAEGVETAAQLALVRRFKCDQAQGFLLSRPIPASEVQALLALPRPFSAFRPGRRGNGRPGPGPAGPPSGKR